MYRPITAKLDGAFWGGGFSTTSLMKRTKLGAGGEIQLTDGLRSLIEEEPVYAYRYKGPRYDAGNKLEYLMATVEFALQREDLGEEFQTYLKSLKL